MPDFEKLSGETAGQRRWGPKAGGRRFCQEVRTHLEAPVGEYVGGRNES